MKRFALSLLLTCSIVFFAQSQYYYKDILSNKQTIADRQLIKAKNIRTVKVHSLEPDGTESQGFFCEKKVSKNFSKIETYTKSNITGKSILTTVFSENGLLISSYDSSESAASYTTYEYDNNNNLTVIKSSARSSDDDFSTSLTEERQYSYNEQSKPVKLFIIKNGKDTTIYDFMLDEKGNVIDEIEYAVNGNHYYYFYNEKNLLTQIVKFNPVKNKLMPDYIFDYNDFNQMEKMVAVEAGPNSDYFTWKYFYNEAGLRIIEKCFSKEKDLMGSFEYEYQ